jgi:hypothetical protein
LDPETEEQSAIVTLLNVVGQVWIPSLQAGPVCEVSCEHMVPVRWESSLVVLQYAGRVQGKEWTPDDYPAQTLEDLAESVEEVVDKVLSCIICFSCSPDEPFAGVEHLCESYSRSGGPCNNLASSGCSCATYLEMLPFLVAVR